MLMVEPTSTIGISVRYFHPATSAHLPRSGAFFTSWNRYRRLADNYCAKSYSRIGNGIRASAKDHSNSSSGSGPLKQNAKPQRYHPFEEIAESEDENGDTRLSPAETTRTIIEVNSKAVLMFSDLVNEEFHENIFWPDLPYVTDEHGNIYFQVKNDEDILQTIASEENLVQVIVGLDAAEMLSELESLNEAENDFEFEFDAEDNDVDDESDDEDVDDEDEDDDSYSQDWVTISGTTEEDQDEDSDGLLGDWSKLETMRSSHPMYFANKIAEVVSDDPFDVMDQPPGGLAIQGFLRPAFVEEHAVIQKHITEEHAVIQKHITDNHSGNENMNQIASVEEHREENTIQVNGHTHEKGSANETPGWVEELEKDETLGNGTSFYKLEMVKIQLISSHGHQGFVEMEDFRKARPDAIAHSAANIIARVKAGGEKTTQALKSLCWRCKGIQVEEVALIGVDSLGIDLRVCSGIQVQTLRLGFNKRASSEYSAERQLNNLLFPKANQKLKQKKEAHQTET